MITKRLMNVIISLYALNVNAYLFAYTAMPIYVLVKLYGSDG